MGPPHPPQQVPCLLRSFGSGPRSLCAIFRLGTGCSLSSEPPTDITGIIVSSLSSITLIEIWVKPLVPPPAFLRPCDWSDPDTAIVGPWLKSSSSSALAGNETLTREDDAGITPAYELNPEDVFPVDGRFCGGVGNEDSEIIEPAELGVTDMRDAGALEREYSTPFVRICGKPCVAVLRLLNCARAFVVNVEGRAGTGEGDRRREGGGASSRLGIIL